MTLKPHTLIAVFSERGWTISPGLSPIGSPMPHIPDCVLAVIYLDVVRLAVRSPRNAVTGSAVRCEFSTWHVWLTFIAKTFRIELATSFNFSQGSDLRKFRGQLCIIKVSLELLPVI